MAGVIERLQFLLTMDSSGAIKGFKNIGSVASQELGKAQGSMDRVAHSMNRVGGGSLAVAGVIGRSLFNVASGFQNSAISAGVFSDATRMSMEQSSRWIEVADEMNVSSSDLQTAFTKMERTLASSPDKFRQLGVEVAKTSTGTVDAQETFLNLVDRLNEITDPAQRAKTAADILGRGWQSNAELISRGSARIRQSLAEVSSSQIFDAQDRKKAEEMRKAMDNLTDAGEQLRNNLARGAVPVISQLTNVTSTAVGAFARLDDVSNGSLGAFTAIATTGLGAAGAMSLIAGQAMKAKDNLLKVNDAGSTVLTGMGKITVGFAALSTAIAIGTMAWSALTAKKREAAARTAEVSKVLVDEVMNLIHEKNAVDASRVGFEALSKTLTTVGADGTKLSQAMGQLGLTNADSAQTLADFKLSGDKGYETLRKLAIGAGVSEGAASNLAKAISENDVQFEDSALKAMGLTDAQLGVGKAMMEVRDQAEKTDIFKDMTDAIWKMASSGKAGQEALQKVNKAIGSGTDKKTTAERYKRLSQELYGLPDAADAAGEGVKTLAEELEELSGKTSSQIKLQDMWNESTVPAIALLKAQADMLNYRSELISESNTAIGDAVDVEADFRSAIIDSREDLELLNEELEKAGKDHELINAIVAEHVKTQFDDADAIAEGRLATMDYISEQDKSAAKSLLQAEALRQVVKQVGKDSPLGKGLLEVIALLEDIPEDIRIRIYAQMTGNLPSNPMTTPGLTRITKGKNKGKWQDANGKIVGATGGVVTRPTMALIGEAGPEMVVPLNRTPGSSPLPSGVGGGGNTFNIHVSAPQGQDPYTWGQAIVKAIKAFERTNGAVFKAA